MRFFNVRLCLEWSPNMFHALIFARADVPIPVFFLCQILSSCLPLFVSSRNGNHCVKRTRCVMGPNNGCEENQTGRKDRAGRGQSVKPPFVLPVGLFLSYYLCLITLI